MWMWFAFRDCWDPRSFSPPCTKTRPSQGKQGAWRWDVTGEWSQTNPTKNPHDLLNLESLREFLICTLEWLGGIYNFKWFPSQVASNWNNSESNEKKGLTTFYVILKLLLKYASVGTEYQVVRKKSTWEMWTILILSVKYLSDLVSHTFSNSTSLYSLILYCLLAMNFTSSYYWMNRWTGRKHKQINLWSFTELYQQLYFLIF